MKVESEWQKEYEIIEGGWLAFFRKLWAALTRVTQ
jgi:hypothetical protein